MCYDSQADSGWSGVFFRRLFEVEGGSDPEGGMAGFGAGWGCSAVPGVPDGREPLSSEERWRRR